MQEFSMTKRYNVSSQACICQPRDDAGVNLDYEFTRTDSSIGKATLVFVSCLTPASFQNIILTSPSSSSTIHLHVCLNYFLTHYPWLIGTAPPKVCATFTQPLLWTPFLPLHQFFSLMENNSRWDEKGMPSHHHTSKQIQESEGPIYISTL